MSYALLLVIVQIDLTYSIMFKNTSGDKESLYLAARFPSNIRCLNHIKNILTFTLRYSDIGLFGLQFFHKCRDHSLLPLCVSMVPVRLIILFSIRFYFDLIGSNVRSSRPPALSVITP